MAYFALLLGVVFFFIGLVRLAGVLKLRGYTKVAAEIISVDTIEFVRPEVYVMARYFVPDVLYKYTVNNCVYEGNVVFPSRRYIMFEDEMGVRLFLSKLRANKCAYYNPLSPADAVLYLPDFSRILNRDGVLLLVGVALSIFAIAFLL